MANNKNIQTDIVKDFLVGSFCQIFIGFAGGITAFEIAQKYLIYNQVKDFYFYTSILILLLLLLLKSAYGFSHAANRTQLNSILLGVSTISLIATATLWRYEILHIHEAFDSIGLNFDLFFVRYIKYYLIPNVAIVTSLTILSRWSSVKTGTIAMWQRFWKQFR